MPLNKRDEAILDWVQKNHPDAADNLEKILQLGDECRATASYYFLMATAFEAGRKFQADNPKLELDNPSIY